MAYRSAKRTRRPARKSGRAGVARSSNRTYTRKAKAHKRPVKGKRRAAAKGLTKRQATQVLRIVLTHEGQNPVQRPAGEGAIVAKAPKKAKF